MKGVAGRLLLTIQPWWSLENPCDDLSQGQRAHY